MVTKDLGMVTAYAYAVAGGYTGTEAEFTQLMADLAVVVDDFDNFSVNVTTLPAGSSATASYADGVLSLGIPKGDKGDKGNTGETGAPAGFGTVSATVDDNIGTPSVEVTASGADTAKNFAFAFHNLKGEKGDKGDTGEVSEAELTQAFEDFSENGTVANAEQLTTDIRANDQSPYLFRTSGGSVDIGDREYINGIVGGTVAWNQMYNHSDIISNTINGVTFTVNSNGTIIVNGTATDVIRKSIIASSFGVHANVGRKLLWYGCPSGGNANGYKISVAYIGENTRDIGNGAVWSIPDTPYSGALAIIISEGTVCDNLVFKPQLFDLTQMFGSTIADYIYALETANAGAGVAWFKKMFPKPYYAYNAGELKSVSGLVSHDMTGFNLFDADTVFTQQGFTKESDGSWKNVTATTVAQEVIFENKLSYSGSFCVSFDVKYSVSTGSAGLRPRFVYTDGTSTTNYIDASTSFSKKTFVTNSSKTLDKIIWDYGSSDPSTWFKNFCVNIAWDNSRNGEYEPYELHSYPLDSDLTLRGIPKLDANNNLYYDGDVYESDGTVTRKCGVGTLTGNDAYGSFAERTNTVRILRHEFPNQAFNSSSVNTRIIQMNDAGLPTLPPDGVWATDVEGVCELMNYNQAGIIVSVNKSRLSEVSVAGILAWITAHPITVVYELQTPTTETADPYTSPQIVNDFGTEEFVLSDSVFPVPVGHNTDYPINLKAKVEMMPNSPSGDGDYIVRQTNGVNEYVSIANNATIQNILSRLEALEG